MWHVTCDTWHVTHDMWHIKCDTWHLTPGTWHRGEVNLLSEFQLPSSYGLGMKVCWRYFCKGWPSHLINELMSNGGVWRTAPASPGLLKPVRGDPEQNSAKLSVSPCFARVQFHSPVFAHFLPENGQKIGTNGQIRVRLFLPKFSRIRSFLFVVRMRSSPPSG